MRRLSIVCTLAAVLLACGGSTQETPTPEEPDSGTGGQADSGSSKHHDAGAIPDAASGGDDDGDDDDDDAGNPPGGDDDDDDASLPTDAATDASHSTDATTDAGAPDAAPDASFDASADASADAAPDAAPDASADAGSKDAAADASLPLPPGQCTGTFGSGLTNDYGRLDGVLQAYVKPGTANCPDQDNNHLILQVAMKGAIYEIAVNVLSDDGSDVLTTSTNTQLVGGAYSEGWHTRASLDYPHQPRDPLDRVHRLQRDRSGQPHRGPAHQRHPDHHLRAWLRHRRPRHSPLRRQG